MAAMERLTLDAATYNVILTPKLNGKGDRIAARATLEKTRVSWFYHHGSIWHSFSGPEMERMRKSDARLYLAMLAAAYPNQIVLEEMSSHRFRWRR